MSLAARLMLKNPLVEGNASRDFRDEVPVKVLKTVREARESRYRYQMGTGHAEGIGKFEGTEYIRHLCAITADLFVKWE